jgi:hypothetical protein
MLRTAIESVNDGLVGHDARWERLLVLDGISITSETAALTRGWEILALDGAGGISRALNYGVSAAGCEYVVRMDADDIWAPQRALSVESLASSDPDIITGGIVKFGAVRAYREGPPKNSPAAVEALLHTGYAFAHPATTIRRSVVAAAGGYRTEYNGFEDMDLWLRLFATGVTLVGTNRCHVYYRVHSGQMTRRGFPSSAGRISRLALEAAAHEPCGTVGCPGRLPSMLAITGTVNGPVCPAHARGISLRRWPLAREGVGWRHVLGLALYRARGYVGGLWEVHGRTHAAGRMS